MLRFLSSFFASSAEQPEGLDEALIEKATERLVAGTDSRIRALGGYRQRLREPVIQAVNHVISLVDALPPPVEISPKMFGSDDCLRAFFVSTDHLRQVLSKFNALREFLDGATLPPEDVFGLLTMTREERTVFGMELEGDSLRRDVRQVAVNFTNHRYLGPADNEFETRRELKIRAFDFLIGKVLERMTNERCKRVELERQRHLLQEKLNIMKAGQWGLESMLADSELERPDLTKLENEIEKIDVKLGQFYTDKPCLEESLNQIAERFSRPADWLSLRQVKMRLDYRGVIIPESSEASAREISLPELFSVTGESRTVFLGRISRADIPEQTNCWEAAKNYL